MTADLRQLANWLSPLSVAPDGPNKGPDIVAASDRHPWWSDVGSEPTRMYSRRVSAAQVSQRRGFAERQSRLAGMCSCNSGTSAIHGGRKPLLHRMRAKKSAPRGKRSANWGNRLQDAYAKFNARKRWEPPRRTNSRAVPCCCLAFASSRLSDCAEATGL